jgi:hypothetical protein
MNLVSVKELKECKRRMITPSYKGEKPLSLLCTFRKRTCTPDPLYMGIWNSIETGWDGFERHKKA